jgi:hypothetical protein
MHSRPSAYSAAIIAARAAGAHFRRLADRAGVVFAPARLWDMRRRVMTTPLREDSRLSAAATEIHFKALQRYNRCAAGITCTFQNATWIICSGSRLFVGFSDDRGLIFI